MSLLLVARVAPVWWREAPALLRDGWHQGGGTTAPRHQGTPAPAPRPTGTLCEAPPGAGYISILPKAVLISSGFLHQKAIERKWQERTATLFCATSHFKPVLLLSFNLTSPDWRSDRLVISIQYHQQIKTLTTSNTIEYDDEHKSRVGGTRIWNNAAALHQAGASHTTCASCAHLWQASSMLLYLTNLNFLNNYNLLEMH